MQDQYSYNKLPLDNGDYTHQALGKNSFLLDVLSS